MDNSTEMDNIHINVGGTEFQTFHSTLQKFPNSLLAKAIDSRENYDGKRQCYFFDRSPDNFNKILEAFRKGWVHFSDGACGIELVEELEYWKIPLSVVAPCCTGRLDAALHERNVAKAVKDEIATDCDRSLRILAQSSGWQRNRIRLWMFMQIPVYSAWAQVRKGKNLSQ